MVPTRVLTLLPSAQPASASGNTWMVTGTLVASRSSVTSVTQVFVIIECDINVHNRKQELNFSNWRIDIFSIKIQI